MKMFLRPFETPLPLWLCAFALCLLATHTADSQPLPAHFGADSGVAPSAAQAVAGQAVTDHAATDAEIPVGHEPRFTTSIEPKEDIAIGDVVHLTIEVTVPDGDDATLPDQALAPFEILSSERTPLPPSGSARKFLFKLQLLAFETGTFTLDNTKVRIVTADGFVFSTLAPTSTITIKSLISNEPNAELKVDSPPVVVMEDDYTLAYAGGAVLGILLIIGLTLLLQRYLAGRARESEPPPPPRPPWEIAVEELAALRRQKYAMVDDGQTVEFVDRVSDVIRAYLGRSYAFAGLDTTTAELLDRLRTRGAPVGLQEETRDYLGRCDLVKFAKVDPDRDEVDLIFAKAQDIVQFSMPQQTPGSARRDEEHAP